ncbi:beta-galactoside alpha-2,6-sialyltransferase 2 [Spodoptera litura]|uniref:Beta-galactoside alpha-2,6-sialyltransferase 1 n=1 Tax=Spodoptera litura TaxID=69820 RepID=A0A9J7E8J1_SPOLT|nr:beta-galactoside alpha-2,6-sialyltransferase 2 [Spodoptera litura]
MKAAAMSVWIFINVLCFGMCGYLYLIWYQYWMHEEKQRNLTKSDNPPKTMISGVNYAIEKNNSRFLLNSTLRIEFLRKNRRSAVGGFWSSGGSRQMSNKTSSSYHVPSNNIVRKSNGSPRFPNIDRPLLEFDSDKYICNDVTSSDCKERTAKFKELLLKEFHRVLMGESKVFTSGLDVHNTYDVKYDSNSPKKSSREEVMCALKSVEVQTVTADDEPFARLGFKIPRAPLQEQSHYNTCAVVTSAGALLGSDLGEFIDSHDMVLRFNNAPTENYTESVGSKTTFRVLNSQVVAKPEFNFLEDPLYRNVSILIWDPANYTSSLEDWYHHPDYPLFPIYKTLLDRYKNADVHLLNPQVLWALWSVLQDTSPYRLRRNPPSSGFLGLWFALHRCMRVRMFEYVPSARATRRCHYHAPAHDAACTLGAWHPLAHEKTLAERLRDNKDVQVFQQGIIDIPGFRTITCH